MTAYRCSMCGCTDLPPAFRRTIAEFENLGGREKLIAYKLVWNSVIHGQPGSKDWAKDWTYAINEILRELMPSYYDAKEIGDIDRVLLDSNSEDEDEDERPEAWSSGGGRDKRWEAKS